MRAGAIERGWTTEHKDSLACRWTPQTHLIHSKVESCLHHFFPRSGDSHFLRKGIIYFLIERSLKSDQSVLSTLHLHNTTCLQAASPAASHLH